MFRVAAIFIALGVPASAYAQSSYHHRDMTAGPTTSALAVPTQPGQGAFAAIQEIVEILKSNP